MRTDKVPRRRRKSVREREGDIFGRRRAENYWGENESHAAARRETRENCNSLENEFPPGLISATERETEREVCSASEVKGLQSPLSRILREMKRERK